MSGVDNARRASPPASGRELGKITPPRSSTQTLRPPPSSLDEQTARSWPTDRGPDPPPAARQLPKKESGDDHAIAFNAETTQPLAPPPRPAPQSNLTDTPDYFSTVHNSSHFSLEPNPFEQSFGGTAPETPGKSMLPSVAALASPASLLQGGASSTGFNWPNSLRAGPLSPAMLTGPTGAGDYFDGQLRAGFPTPNESSLRTGLTPGGGGSMFPAPSPNSQALFQQLASGGATPSTLDFHRTAMNAAAARKAEAGPGGQATMGTSQAHEAPVTTAEDDDGLRQPPEGHSSRQQTASNPNDPFGSHDANDAANGLFLLANGTQGPNNFPAERTASLSAPPVKIPPPADPARRRPPATAKRAAGATDSSLRGSLSGSLTGMSEMSAEFSEGGPGEPSKPNTRNKGGRKGAAATKGAPTAAARRKAEDTPSKPPANKKSKGAAGNHVPEPESDSEEEEEEEEVDMNAEMLNEHGKKMTDEEKRKNFLERNR